MSDAECARRAAQLHTLKEYAMNDNWQTYQKLLAVLLGNVPLPVPFGRAVVSFGEPERYVAPTPDIHCEQLAASLRLPGIARRRL